MSTQMSRRVLRAHGPGTPPQPSPSGGLFPLVPRSLTEALGSFLSEQRNPMRPEKLFRWRSRLPTIDLERGAYHATKAALAGLRSGSTCSAGFRNGYDCTARIEHLSFATISSRPLPRWRRVPWGGRFVALFIATFPNALRQAGRSEAEINSRRGDALVIANGSRPVRASSKTSPRKFLRRALTCRECHVGHPSAGPHHYPGGDRLGRGAFVCSVFRKGESVVNHVFEGARQSDHQSASGIDGRPLKAASGSAARRRD
jgi:hypothetical protein